MSTVQRVFSCYKNLKPITHFLNVNSVRHLPRWTHRTPSRIITNEISNEEKEKWKLGVENEFRMRTSTSSDVVNYTESSDKIAPGLECSNEVTKKNACSQFHETRFHANNVPKNLKVEDSNAHDHFLKDSLYREELNYLEQKTIPPSKTPSLKGAIKKTVGQNKVNSKISEERNKLKKSALKLGVPVFIDLGKDNTILSRYMANVKSKKRREKIGNILLEGKRLIKDALTAGIQPEAIFFSQIRDLKYLDISQTGINIYKLTYKELCLFSDVATPQGIMAFVKIPDLTKVNSTFLPLTVICDNVRDPGNMGSIIRTCAGIGCQQMFITKGCVDIWDPKVLRSAAGAHFRVSITKDMKWSELKTKLSPGCSVLIAENETLPDSKDVDTSSGEDQNIKKRFQLPFVPYYSFDYTVSSLVLIIGGETEGVSLDAYKLVSESGGVRLNVPLCNEVESLNVGVALGIIGFEMKKQLLMKSSQKSPETEEPVDSNIAVC